MRYYPLALLCLLIACAGPHRIALAEQARVSALKTACEHARWEVFDSLATSSLTGSNQTESETQLSSVSLRQFQGKADSLYLAATDLIQRGKYTKAMPWMDAAGSAYTLILSTYNDQQAWMSFIRKQQTLSDKQSRMRELETLWKTALMEGSHD